MAKAVRGPSMFDVARLAGVSHQTVSRVLNDHPNVRDTTRARVRSAIEQLGYRPNRAARTLVTGRDQVLGIVAPRSTLFGPVSLLAAFEEQAGLAGFGIHVVRVPEHVAGQVADAVTTLLDAQVAGVVVIAPVADVAGALDEVSGDVPLVTVDGDPTDDRPMATVDQELGARLATEHLLAAGHRTVWHVGGPTDWFDATGRARGWAAALRDAGVEPPPIVPGDWSPDAGYQAGQFLGRMPEVTAVFTANDGLATGLLHALHDLGRDVPGQISVVGFDDVPASAHLVPPLTTLRPDFEAVAREALDLLLADPDPDDGSADGPGGLHRHVAPVLVSRASVAAPPSAGREGGC